MDERTLVSPGHLQLVVVEHEDGKLLQLVKKVCLQAFDAVVVEVQCKELLQSQAVAIEGVDHVVRQSEHFEVAEAVEDVCLKYLKKSVSGWTEGWMIN